MSVEVEFGDVHNSSQSISQILMNHIQSAVHTFMDQSDAERLEVQRRRSEIDQQREEIHSQRVEIDQQREEIHSQRVEIDQQREEIHSQRVEIDQQRTAVEQQRSEIGHLRAVVEREHSIVRELLKSKSSVYQSIKNAFVGHDASTVSVLGAGRFDRIQTYVQLSGIYLFRGDRGRTDRDVLALQIRAECLTFNHHALLNCFQFLCTWCDLCSFVCWIK